MLIVKSKKIFVYYMNHLDYRRHLIFQNIVMGLFSIKGKVTQFCSSCQ